MKRNLTRESGFDGVRCKVRKVLSAGHCNTSSVDLLEQKSKLKHTHTHTQTQCTYVSRTVSSRIKHRKFLNVSPGGEVMKPMMVETNVDPAY
jgi:hypothetical protein